MPSFPRSVVGRILESDILDYDTKVLKNTP